MYVAVKGGGPASPHVDPIVNVAPLVVSAAPVGRDGVLLRAAAESFEDASRELRSALRFAWDALGDDPWSSRG